MVWGQLIVPDVVVKFDVVDKNRRGGYLDSTAADLMGTIVNDKRWVPTLSQPTLARTFYVRTEAGVARLTFRWGQLLEDNGLPLRQWA